MSPGTSAAAVSRRAAADCGNRLGPDRVPGVRRTAEARGRRSRLLHDIPAFRAPVELVWRQRRYRCTEPACPVRGFSEIHALAPPRAKLTGRAAWWAISCIQRDNASVASVARRLGVDWHTVWEVIKPLLEELVDDPGRLAGSMPSASTSTLCATRRCCSGWR